MAPSTDVDLVALALAVRSQPARASRLLKAAGAPWPRTPLDQALACLRLDRPGASVRWRSEALPVLEAAARAGYTLLHPALPGYPESLASTVDPPLLLWVRGDPACLTAPAIAIVGARRATAAGRDVARSLGAGLAAAGLVVVSGFAQGIDAAAHHGAVQTGTSVAVLGCGLDQDYPRDHHALGQAIAARGALVSEFVPGTPPLAHHFPLRNRVLSGLSLAVVLVQAAEKSGSLITARLALEQGRDVLVVPADVRGGVNSGGHALIRDGARLVEHAGHVLDDLGWASSRGGGAGPEGVGRPAAEPDRHALVTWLAREGGATLEALLAETGRNQAELLQELTDLELAGRVCRDAAGRFQPSERKW